MNDSTENPCKHPNAEILSYCPDCDEWMGMCLALPNDEDEEEDEEE